MTGQNARKISIRKRVAKNFTALFAIRGINLVVQIVAIPYILQKIGIENYGLIAFSLAFATFFGTFIQYGFGISAVGNIARIRDDHAQVSKIFSATFVTMLLITLICTGIYSVIIFSIDAMASEKLVYFGSLLLVVGNSLFPHWVFLGLERSYLAAVTMLCVRLSYLALLFLFVRGPEDYSIVHLLNGLTAIAGVVSGLIITFGVLGLKLVVPSMSCISETLKGGFHVFLIQFVPNLYNNALIFILGLTNTPQIVGIFSAASSIVDVTISICRILSNSFLPALINNISLHKKYTVLLLGTGLLAMIMLVAFANVIGKFLSPYNHAEIANTIRHVAISIPMTAGYLAYNINYLVITGHQSLASKITVTISLFGMTLVLLLVPTYSITGAIVVLIATRFSLFIVSYHYYKRVSR